MGNSAGEWTIIVQQEISNLNCQFRYQILRPGHADFGRYFCKFSQVRMPCENEYKCPLKK